jgi:hypothetical protein
MYNHGQKHSWFKSMYVITVVQTYSKYIAHGTSRWIRPLNEKKTHSFWVKFENSVYSVIYAGVNDFVAFSEN